ncbi:MAG TPA: hypothetical protein V6C78_03495 [Crinalium sp.]|jgi:hypothetical protein
MFRSQEPGVRSQESGGRDGGDRGDEGDGGDREAKNSSYSPYPTPHTLSPNS